MAAFPEIDLDASAPPAGQTYHKLVLTFVTRQDGQPWAKQTNEYEHVPKAQVAYITGQIAGAGAKLGPKGNSPKNANWDLDVTMTVDGQMVTTPLPSWNGKTREFVLAAERGMLMMFLRMNEDSTETNKAHGKI